MVFIHLFSHTSELAFSILGTFLNSPLSFTILSTHHDKYNNLLEILKTKVCALSITDLYILWSLNTFSCEILDPIPLREYLGIKDIDSLKREECIGVGRLVPSGDVQPEIQPWI